MNRSEHRKIAEDLAKKAHYPEIADMIESQLEIAYLNGKIDAVRESREELSVAVGK